MKFLFIILTFLSFSFAATKVAVIEVSGMTCPLCTSAVKRSLKHTKGVQSAKVLLNTKRATVVFDDAVTSQKELLQAVKNAGYGGVIKSIKDR